MRQLPIDRIRCNSVAFVCPRDRITLRPLLALGWRDLPHELEGVASLVTLHRWCKNAAVPNGVQVCRVAHENNLHIVAAAVVMVGSVKRLVHVGHKMDEVLQSL